MAEAAAPGPRATPPLPAAGSLSGAAADDLPRRLRRVAEAAPERRALVWQDGESTYAQLHERVCVGAAALRRLGIAPGDRVGVVLGTTPWFVETVVAVLRAGGVVVPLLPGLAPDELRFALLDCEARAAVVGPERLREVGRLRPQLPAMQHLIGAGVDATSRPAGVLDWEQLLSDAGDAPGPPDDADADGGADERLAAILYTSGTTGRPRGAMLTRRNLAANQDQSLAGRLTVGPDDVVLLVLPLAHVYAFNVGLGASISAGATMVLEERFEPAASLDAIRRHGVTVVLGAPPLYVAWLDSDADLASFASVRLAISGAAPLPVPVFERFRERTGCTIEEGYGLTEASPSVTSSAMAPSARAGSVGLPLPDVQLRLVDDDGQDVGPGDPGELWVRGPNVFAGYWGAAEATARTLSPDGWLRTGDIATRDDDGHLYLVDRKGDLILVNGFNVYPREVERVLLEDPAVAQAGVVGVAHPLTGEAVVAHVVPRAGATLDVDALRSRCRERLARYKCPTHIEVADHLPTTATGKLRRAALRRDASGPAADRSPGPPDRDVPEPTSSR